MIKFFRRIRQNLLSEGKTVKYLKYAIGEIILVVIGILIALQINKWNDYLKEREDEHLILSEIRDNLKYDLNDFESNIIHLKNKTTSSKTLLEVLDSHTSYQDSLGFYFSLLKSYPHFSNKTNGYNLLLSKGLGVILNNDLRNNITNLYEDDYQYLLTFENERIQYNKVLLEKAMRPYMGVKKLSMDQTPVNLTYTESTQLLLKFGYFRNIMNFNKLREDFELQSMIKDVEIWSSTLTVVHTNVKKNVLDLILQIEQELENNKSLR